jgi:hypothetical protein
MHLMNQRDLAVNVWGLYYGMRMRWDGWDTGLITRRTRKAPPSADAVTVTLVGAAVIFHSS